eukprot:2296438-Pleurochrysis_carterae.AAC.1
MAVGAIEDLLNSSDPMSTPVMALAGAGGGGGAGAPLRQQQSQQQHHHTGSFQQPQQPQTYVAEEVTRPAYVSEVQQQQ